VQRVVLLLFGYTIVVRTEKVTTALAEKYEDSIQMICGAPNTRILFHFYCASIVYAVIWTCT
jgi:hypothetical protein